MIDRETGVEQTDTYVHIADDMHVDNVTRFYHYAPIASSSFR